MKVVKIGRLAARDTILLTLPESRRLACYSDRRFTLRVPEGAYPAASAPCPEGGDPWYVFVWGGILVGVPPEAFHRWKCEIETVPVEPKEDDDARSSKAESDDSILEDLGF